MIRVQTVSEFINRQIDARNIQLMPQQAADLTMKLLSFFGKKSKASGERYGFLSRRKAIPLEAESDFFAISRTEDGF
jgi:hypothetical protein